MDSGDDHQKQQANSHGHSLVAEMGLLQPEIHRQGYQHRADKVSAIAESAQQTLGNKASKVGLVARVEQKGQEHQHAKRGETNSDQVAV